ncbi:hypothetical protein JXR93_12860 [bacterium]|nr:hypothetical protein [bacterium]
MRYIIFTILFFISINLLSLEGIEKLYSGVGIQYGPSISYIDSDVALNFDLALSNIIPNDFTFFTISINQKAILKDKTYLMTELEGTLYFFIVLGGGVGWYGEKFSDYKMKSHLFLGLPIYSIANISSIKILRSFFIEPYMRVHKISSTYYNEYGVYLKFSSHQGINIF